MSNHQSVRWRLLLSFCPFLLLLSIRPSLTLLCKNCRNFDGQISCEQSCQADVCVLWQWNDDKKNKKHLIQGCMTGVKDAPLPLGCRSNDEDALLCLCKEEDECNHQKKVRDEDIKSLATVKCRHYVEAPFFTPQSKETVCESNFCFFTQTKVTNFKNEMETQTTADCGQLPQYTFDVQVASIWPGPGVLADGCYLLQAKGQDTTLGCMCAQEGCNLQQPFVIRPGDVTCHLGYHLSDDAGVETNNSCKGDFCLIQKTSIPDLGVRYMKGCLSIGGTDAARRSIQSGYRNILGVEQWVCKTDLCNKEIDTAVVSARRTPLTDTDTDADTDTDTPTSQSLSSFKLSIPLCFISTLLLTEYYITKWLC